VAFDRKGEVKFTLQSAITPHVFVLVTPSWR
jgi:hypothetical protein